MPVVAPTWVGKLTCRRMAVCSSGIEGTHIYGITDFRGWLKSLIIDGDHEKNPRFGFDFDNELGVGDFAMVRAGLCGGS